MTKGPSWVVLLSLLEYEKPVYCHFTKMILKSTDSYY